MALALVVLAPESCILESAEALERGGKAGFILAVVLADMGIEWADPAAVCVVVVRGSGGECAALGLDVIEPVEDTVWVRGIAKLLLVFCARETASDSEAGDALRWTESMIADEDALGDVTRGKGSEDALKSAAEEEEEEPGLEDPLMLPIEAEASDPVRCRFLLEAELRAPTLLEAASSGTSGIPADRN